MNNYKLVITWAVIVGLVVFGVIKFTSRGNIVAGVDTAEAYMSTTTAPTMPTEYLLKNGPGVFGSVIISKTDTGTIAFYDATTSDATKRAAVYSTTTIQRVYIPASPTVGTYTYDVVFNNGILMVLSSSTVASSTITWK